MLKVILKFLDNVIHRSMDEFRFLGADAKALNALDKPEEEISEKHREMHEILRQLQPVEERVRFLYPELCGLFDLLKEEYRERKQ